MAAHLPGAYHCSDPTSCVPSSVIPRALTYPLVLLRFGLLPLATCSCFHKFFLQYLVPKSCLLCKRPLAAGACGCLLAARAFFFCVLRIRTACDIHFLHHIASISHALAPFTTDAKAMCFCFFVQSSFNSPYTCSQSLLLTTWSSFSSCGRNSPLFEVHDTVVSYLGHFIPRSSSCSLTELPDPLQAFHLTFLAIVYFQAVSNASSFFVTTPCCPCYHAVCCWHMCHVHVLQFQE